MASARSISVEVIYAEPGVLFLERVALDEGSTVADAIERSGFREQFPGVRLFAGNVGVFARKVGPGHVLADNDRVEIYRPLRLTPNEIRKRRALRNAGKGG